VAGALHDAVATCCGGSRLSGYRFIEAVNAVGPGADCIELAGFASYACAIEHPFVASTSIHPEPEVVEERRRKAQEVAAQRSKALIESFRPPMGELAPMSIQIGGSLTVC
jgi:hypothetical protein